MFASTRSNVTAPVEGMTFGGPRLINALGAAPEREDSPHLINALGDVFTRQPTIIGCIRGWVRATS